MESFIWAIFFSFIGISYYIYGKRRDRDVMYFSGIALCIFPYFVSGALLIFFIGAALMALPFIIKR